MRFGALACVLILLTVGGIAASLALGSVRIALPDVLHALTDAEPQTPEAKARRTIVYDLRLPRALLAATVGGALAVSGTLLQGVMRNPLAAPNIVGLTAGAGLAATIVLALRHDAINALPPCAFVGAIGAGLVVYALSIHPTQGASPVRMVLAGVAVTAVLTAITTLLMVLNPTSVQSVVLWMSGTLNGLMWRELWATLPYIVVATVAALALARPLDLLQLGDDHARSLGVRVEPVRFGTVALAAVLCGAAVSVAGMIGFVGLVVPHLLRFIVGPKHLTLIIASALGGAALLVLADLAARTIRGDQGELPAGILTALLGGPYFIFLLHRARLIR